MKFKDCRLYVLFRSEDLRLADLVVIIVLDYYYRKTLSNTYSTIFI